MALKDLNLTDLWFTSDGDFLLDGAGDLKDTRDSGDVYEGLRQQITHRVISEKNGWRLHPNILAGLDRYLGNTIDDQLLEQLEFEITRALTADGNLTKSDFSVQTIELTPGDVAIMIYLNTLAQRTPIVTMAYSIQTGTVARVK